MVKVEESSESRESSERGESSESSDSGESIESGESKFLKFRNVDLSMGRFVDLKRRQKTKDIELTDEYAWKKEKNNGDSE